MILNKLSLTTGCYRWYIWTCSLEYRYHHHHYHRHWHYHCYHYQPLLLLEFVLSRFSIKIKSFPHYVKKDFKVAFSLLTYIIFPFFFNHYKQLRTAIIARYGHIPSVLLVISLGCFLLKKINNSNPLTIYINAAKTSISYKHYLLSGL